MCNLYNNNNNSEENVPIWTKISWRHKTYLAQVERNGKIVLGKKAPKKDVCMLNRSRSPRRIAWRILQIWETGSIPYQLTSVIKYSSSPQ